MRINHNISALNTYSRLSAANTMQSKSLEKLSSGMRINRAGDDAAGLAISEKMRAQIRGLEQASRNAQDGISMIQTAEGALNETQAILQRMRELAVQATNDTNVDADRQALQDEIDQLVDEIDRIANTTEFNTKNLLNGSLGVSVEDSSIVTKASMSADTQNGTYTVDLSGATLGTTANIGGAIATDASGLAQGTGTLTVNGVDFSIDTTTRLEDLASDITNKVNGVTATYDSVADTFNIETDEVGADQTLDVTASAANLINGEDWSGGSAISATGTNISGVNVDGMGADTNVAYDGNKVIVTGGNSKGLEFEALQVGSSVDITVGDSAALQIGANEGQSMSISINAMDASNLGVSSIDVTSATSAESSITTINDAITTVSSERAKLGAYQNRLEHTINNLNTASENLTASESRIRDVDMAKEMMEFTKNNILQQAAQAMLAQAQQQPQGVLQLLR
ncbi:flagellin [Caldisalinibacter kiritimatiensis]|uniref:Flagellin n=1 Tax=Caldisalinibacter kiritimatiensis TaxID=1304284 RepID=R1ATC1_9FIRM|nr:flagellin [Caldisalinibacter kiritimatiensis]EOD00373.1 Flagellin protein FlaA [Caldisalinibacter kiritimatiensis]